MSALPSGLRPEAAAAVAKVGSAPVTGRCRPPEPSLTPPAPPPPGPTPPQTTAGPATGTAVELLPPPPLPVLEVPVAAPVPVAPAPVVVPPPVEVRGAAVEAGPPVPVAEVGTGAPAGDTLIALPAFARRSSNAGLAFRPRAHCRPDVAGVAGDGGLGPVAHRCW
ncbi:MAG: hypothetical protein ACRD0D_10510 [Acidimicrobiales bacterium]